MAINLDLASITASTPLRTLRGVSVRAIALVDAATVTPNSDTTDIGTLATLSQTTTFANPTGTPFNGQLLEIRITSAVSRVIAFGAAYQAASILGFPTATTGASKEDYIAFRYNSITAKWDLINSTINISADGYILNGVAQFTRATNPTTRIGGGALVVGDRLYRTDLRMDAFWFGSVAGWLSEPIITRVAQLDNSTSINYLFFTAQFATFPKIFVEKVWWNGRTGTGNNAANYRNLNLLNSVYATLASVGNTSLQVANTWFSREINLNLLITTSGAVLDSATPTMIFFYLEEQNVLTPNAVSSSLQVSYRLVMP